MTRCIVALPLTSVLFSPAAALAQESGDIAHGREIAQTICSACHVVTRDKSVSPNSASPPFPTIAATPGMTAIALTAVLTTSHRLMPNIILQPDERRDVIAYILTLK
jgi:mono/diheme cytochrome c family protein